MIIASVLFKSPAHPWLMSARSTSTDACQKMRALSDDARGMGIDTAIRVFVDEEESIATRELVSLSDGTIEHPPFEIEAAIQADNTLLVWRGMRIESAKLFLRFNLDGLKEIGQPAVYQLRDLRTSIVLRTTSDHVLRMPRVWP